MQKADDIKEVLNILEDKKAQNIKVYDITGKSPFFDKIIVCSASSTRNSQAMITDIKKAIPNKILGMEGLEEYNWVLIDATDYIIHIFLEGAREYYNIDGYYQKIINE